MTVQQKEIINMIKIEFSGTGDEVRNEMLKLLGLQESARPLEPQIKERIAEEQAAESQAGTPKTRRARKARKPAAASATWTEEDASTLLSEIKDNARRILVELANRPEGYPRRELVQALESTEQTVRGQLSSVGSALRRMGKKPTPIIKDKTGDEFTYKLNPTVAAVIKQRS